MKSSNQDNYRPNWIGIRPSLESMYKIEDLNQEGFTNILSNIRDLIIRSDDKLKSYNPKEIMNNNWFKKKRKILQSNYKDIQKRISLGVLKYQDVYERPLPYTINIKRNPLFILKTLNDMDNMIDFIHELTSKLIEDINCVINGDLFNELDINKEKKKIKEFDVTLKKMITDDKSDMILIKEVIPNLNKLEEYHNLILKLEKNLEVNLEQYNKQIKEIFNKLRFLLEDKDYVSLSKNQKNNLISLSTNLSDLITIFGYRQFLSLQMIYIYDHLQDTLLT